ncbi:MAG TPA: YhdP family protein [Cellvibrio sp.]|nr:YhdP family protein [Cellvibrio sp.]
MTTYIRKFIKWFYLLFALAAITVAVVVQAGRSFSHLLADYPQEVSSYLSNKLNAKVTIGAISAEWVGLKPMVDVRKLRIVSQADKPIIALEHARMRLDLLGSFAHARLVWSALQLDRVDMEFVQTPDGFWQIPGLPKRAVDQDQSAELDLLIDMSLLSRRIEFSRSQLSFQFVSGAKTTLNSPLLRMENAGDFHRLVLDIDVAGKPKTLSLVAEGKGDPRNKKTFSSKAFIQLNQFPTNEPIAAVTAFLLRGIKAEVHSQGALDASLWLSNRPQREGFDLVGKLGIQRLGVPVLGRSLALDSFSADVAGHWLYSGQWQLALQQVNAKVNQQKIEGLNFAASAASFADPVMLHMQRLDLEHLNKALDGAGVLGEGRLREVMRQLSPQGELHNLRVAIPTQSPQSWELQANLAQVGVNAWHGVPALRKVDGLVYAHQHGGFVDIDSRQGFSMHYSPTYAAPMEYQQAKGRVAWRLQPDKNQIYVNSGALEFTNGDEHAKGYMWLSIPWQRNSGDIDLYLQIGAKKLDASLYSKYTPAVVPKSLLTWLEKSIGPNNAGFVNEVGFVYRGTLNNRNPAARSHQLFVDMNNAQLNYHPEWPALNGINGRLLVSDNDVFASVDSATLLNSKLGPTQISARPNPDGHGSLLRVEGNVIGGADDGMRILRESMLRRYIGANMDSWTLDGDMQTQLKIAVPLDPAGSGASQQVDIDLQSPHFEMGNIKLAMQNIKGRISFNETAGLSSEGLSGILFGEPVKALLTTKKQGDASQTLVEVAGEVDSHVLAKWTQRPEVLFMRGQFPYQAVVELNHKSTKSEVRDASQPIAVIKVKSPLSGVTVDLPAPYGKAADTERPLQFTMSLFERSSLIRIGYDNYLDTLFELDPQQQNKLTNANIALGSQAKLATEPQFLLSGNLPGLDIELWKKVQQRYLDYNAQIAAMLLKPKVENREQDTVLEVRDTRLVAGLPFRADVLLAHYQVGPLALENMQVRAERLVDGWKIGFTNPLAVGDILLHDNNNHPLAISLESLRLTSQNLGLTNVDPADAVLGLSKKARVSIDPRLLPLADVSVAALYMDDVNYGNWSLLVRPNDKGVVFDNIHGSVKGVTVGGLDEKSGGAKMEWVVADSVASTHFVGALSASNVSDVLREWQKPDMLESQSARFKVDAMWAGDPQDFALKKMAGSIDIWLEKGRFKNNPSPGSDGLLRLMAILNFDSLARRLRLDFSDLYKSGLAYDEISGKASFVSGTMTFTEPLSVKTPSSRLQMAGKLDLENEKIDARLVATLPVVGSYTFFTALVTGLPAAAGIYVVSKLFKKQVDRATSISYSIRGDWSEPKMSFNRLFESEEDLMKSVNSTEKVVKNRKRKPKK